MSNFFNIVTLAKHKAKTPRRRFRFVEICSSACDTYNIVSIYEPVILYGFKTWSLTLTEERKLRVLEHILLRRIFTAKRDEITRKWRKLHNEELNDLYSSSNREE